MEKIWIHATINDLITRTPIIGIDIDGTLSDTMIPWVMKSGRWVPSEARRNGVKNITIKFERRSYTTESGEVKDLWYYLRWLSPVDGGIWSSDFLVNATSVSAWVIMSSPSN